MPPHVAKRPRLSQPADPTIMASADEGSDKYEVFTKWAEERGVEINGVEARLLPERGFGLVTTKAIPADERILLVPKTAMYTPDAKLIKSQQGLDKASPHAQLAISVMSICKAEQSPFAVWEATWPTYQNFVDTLPLCWTKEDQDLLPPSVTLPLERQRRDWEKDWQAVAAYCQDRGCSKEDYRYYWMIVDSRSFHFNPPHAKTRSMVLCPFIDLINHGPSKTTCQVFQSPEGYQVVADRDYGEHTNSLISDFTMASPMLSPNHLDLYALRVYPSALLPISNFS